MRKTSHPILSIAVIITALSISACGGSPPTMTPLPTIEPPTPIGEINIEPRDILNPVEDCPPEILANWIEETDIALDEAEEILNRATGVSEPEQMINYLADLEDLLLGVMEQPVPECAFQAYYLLGAMVDEAIGAATDYIQYQDINIFNTRSANFRLLRQELSSQIESLLPMAGDM